MFLSGIGFRIIIPKKTSSKKGSQFIVDGTQLKVGSEFIWLWWIAIEPKNKEILALSISKERNMHMFVVERFISSLAKIYDKQPVSMDDRGTWYPLQACRFTGTRQHIHSSLEKSIIERTMQQYIKNRIDSFDDDYFPCRRKKRCNLFHVKNWFNLFVNMHNKERIKA